MDCLTSNISGAAVMAFALASTAPPLSKREAARWSEPHRRRRYAGSLSADLISTMTTRASPDKTDQLCSK